MDFLRDARSLVIGLLAGFVGAYAAIAIAKEDTPPTAIKVSELALVNSEGKVAARLSCDIDATPGLVLTSPNGKNKVMLGADNKGGVIAIEGTALGRIAVTSSEGGRGVLGPDKIYLGSGEKLIWRAP